MRIKGLLFVLLTAIFTITGQILMKKGVRDIALSFKAIITNHVLLAGCFCYVISLFFWLNAIKLLPLSIAFPSASISFIGVIIASAIFLAEPINAFKIIGILLICSGVVFIGNA